MRGECGFCAIEIHFKRTLGSVEHQLTIFARLEMLAEGIRGLGGKGSFQVITNGSYCRSASHSDPQGWIPLGDFGASRIPIRYRPTGSVTGFYAMV